jgi:hypothetical protein
MCGLVFADVLSVNFLGFLQNLQKGQLQLSLLTLSSEGLWANAHNVQR